MNPSSFIQGETKELIAQLSGYLEQNLSHVELQAHIEHVFDKWERENIDEHLPCATNEKEFWCAVWTTQHLASQDHWIDGVAQKELGLLLKVLQQELSLPQGYEGRRP